MSRSESYPCIVCGDPLYREVDEFPAQPREGVMCETTGNYGSTVFDSFSGEVVRFNICDACFVRAGERGHLHISLERLPVVCELGYDAFGYSRVGWRSVERPSVPWNMDLEPINEQEVLTPAEVLALWEDRRYHWSVERSLVEKALAAMN